MAKFDSTLAAVLLTTAISNSAYGLIAPFLPFEVSKKGASQSLMGYIFAIYSVAVIIASPLVGMLIKSMGRRSLILIGVLLMGISFMFFGMADYVEDPLIFTLSLFVIRFLQGFSSALI